MVEPCRLEPYRLLLHRKNRRGSGDDQDRADAGVTAKQKKRFFARGGVFFLDSPFNGCFFFLYRFLVKTLSKEKRPFFYLLRIYTKNYRLPKYLIRCKRFFSKDLNLRLLRVLRFCLLFTVAFRLIYVIFHGKRNAVSFKLHVKDRDHNTLVNPYHLAGVFHEAVS